MMWFDEPDDDGAGDWLFMAVVVVCLLIGAVALALGALVFLLLF